MPRQLGLYLVCRVSRVHNILPVQYPSANPEYPRVTASSERLLLFGQVCNVCRPRGARCARARTTRAAFSPVLRGVSEVDVGVYHVHLGPHKLVARGATERVWRQLAHYLR